MPRDNVTKRDAISRVLIVAVFALIAGPIGAAVFVLGFGRGDSPCILCWAQRTAMIQIALAGLFVLRFGPRPRYLGFSVLVAAWGVYMGVRHSALHLARDIGQGFSIELLGAHTYVWSSFIFWICLVTMGALLASLRDGQAGPAARTPRTIERVAMWLFLLAVAANIVQAFASTGPPPFLGQSDPVRFSFNPRHWVWSLQELEPAPMGLRGRWGIERPSLAGLDTNPGNGPLEDLQALKITRHERLSLPLAGSPTDLAYDAATDRFALTTQHGVYITDSAFRRVLRYTIVDPGFSVDLADFVGTAFLDARTLIAVSNNKSYVILREAERADPGRNWRFFLESFDAFDEVARSRFATVRARMFYVMSTTYDETTQSIFTVAVPNSRARKLVVSRFDRGDLTLSEEFVPALRSGPGLALRPARSLDELYVAGATTDAGRLYLLSAAYSTLLVVDPATGFVVTAYAVPGLDRPVGIAVKNGELLSVDGSGSLSFAALPPDATGADRGP